MKKLLYVGGSHSDIPLIRAAKDLGFYVITTGNRPDEIGHTYSDEYHKCDYSDKDTILQLAKHCKADYICPCCNDFSMIASSYVAEQLGLSGFDSYHITQTIHHKDKFRAFCNQYGFPVPKALSFTSFDEAVKNLDKFQFPIIVKPVDLTGGKGVSRVDTHNNAPQCIQKAFAISKEKKIVIEEFITGTHHGLSVFIINKKVAFYFCDDEHYYINKYLVSGASWPGSPSQDVIQKLLDIYSQIATLLTLHDGIFHTQIIVKDNMPFITEICRRPPGDLYVKLVEYATGIKYSHEIIKAYTGLQSGNFTYDASNNGFYTRHCIMSNKPGKIKNIIISADIENNIFDILYLLKKGDEITDYLHQKAGIAFLKYNSIEEMKSKVPFLQELIKVEI